MGDLENAASNPLFGKLKGFSLQDGTKGGTKNGTGSVREKTLPQAPDKQTFPIKESSLSSPHAQRCSLHTPQLFQYFSVSLLTSEIVPWEAQMNLVYCLQLCTRVL